MRTLVVASGKGGVGKSTVCYLLAKSLSRSARVLLLDFDLCGPSMGLLTGSQQEKVFRGAKGLNPVQHTETFFSLSISCLVPLDAAIIWRAPKKAALLKLFIESIDESLYEYIVIDMPPGVTDEHVFLLQSQIKMCALIVTTSQNLALDEAMTTIRAFQRKKVPIIGVIENMQGLLCGACGERTFMFSREGGRLLAESAGVMYLGHIDFLCVVDVLNALPDAVVAAKKAFIEAVQSEGGKAGSL